MNDNNLQNLYVGDRNIGLYTLERKIALKTKEIMKDYIEEFNNKDFIKKSIELFHLLIYFDVNKNIESIKKIVPHEPGDFFVIMKNGTEILYEIVTVFGDKEAKSISDLVKQNLEVNNVNSTGDFEYSKMDIDKLTTQFKRVLSNKKDKSYFLKHENTSLLLVTSEHDRSGTVAWYLLEDIGDSVRDFINKTKSTIKTMNYFSSGKDGNPTVNNIEEELQLYDMIFKGD